MILQRCTHPRPCFDDGKCHYKGECGHKAPLTNADRIRAMSDEELAKMMTSGAGEFDCYECWRTEDEPCDLNCEVRCLEWLRKPVEEG